jgi:hypothetical protein
LLIGERPDVALESVGGGHCSAQLLDEALIAAAKYLGQKLPHAGGILVKRGRKNSLLYG